MTLDDATLETGAAVVLFAAPPDFYLVRRNLPHQTIPNFAGCSPVTRGGTGTWVPDPARRAVIRTWTTPCHLVEKVPL